MTSVAMVLSPSVVGRHRATVDAWIANERLSIEMNEDGDWTARLVVPAGVESFEVADEFVAALMQDGA